MTTLRDTIRDMQIEGGQPVRERRKHRRHDLERANVAVEKVEGRRSSLGLGRVMDLSAGGLRFRTRQRDLQPEQQIRVRLELPTYAGICPFIDRSEDGVAKPKSDWTGWLSVTRVQEVGQGAYEVAGRLIDMEEMDRGMLGLYLSTHPLAA